MVPLLVFGAATLGYTNPQKPHVPPATSPDIKAQSQSRTDLGGLIHFPSKLGAPNWPEAIAALDRLRATLGPRAYVRWDVLWHEANWEPNNPYGYARARYILGLLAERNLRSLMVVIPHPWPGSGWDQGQGGRDWGSVNPAWFPKIATRYRECVTAYRDSLRELAMSETDNAVQWGNEPASGHPGGNGSLQRGTWSGHALWAELHKTTSYYGKLHVIAPALSMLDQAAGTRELATSAIPRGQDWSQPATGKAMHFRYYQPNAATPNAYIDGYVKELGKRMVTAQRTAWPRASATAEAGRRQGMWITEGYIVAGDNPGSRAETWRKLFTRLRAGVPGVKTFIAYRFYPDSGFNADFAIPLEAQTQNITP